MGRSGVQRIARKGREGAAKRDFQILSAPVITEKSSIVGSMTNTVVFRVPRASTKHEIREAVERAFSVKVSRVRTVNVLGKVKSTMKSEGRRSNFKKAYVTLAEGQTLNIVEGM